MAAGLKDRLDFVTYGGNDHPDRIIAEKVAINFDIDMIDRPYFEEDVSPREFINEKGIAGVRWFDDVSFKMKSVRSGFIVFTGNLGETFRNYYAEVGNNKFHYTNSFYLMEASRDNLSCFFNSFSHTNSRYLVNIDKVRDSVLDQLLSYNNCIGLSLFQQYTEFRNRLHYGGATIERNKFMRSYDPLYSISAYLYASRMDPEYQLYGELSFELMAQFFPPVLSIPLSEKYFPPKFKCSEIARRCMLESRPMHGLKNRFQLKNVKRYDYSRLPLTDKINLYLDTAVNALPDSFFDVARLRADITSKDIGFRLRVYKGISTILSFLALVENSARQNDGSHPLADRSQVSKRIHGGTSCQF